MMHVYLGWADCDGLKSFQPETDSTQRRYTQLVRDHNQRVAVWSVLDSSVLATIQSLLDAADYGTAWRCLQTYSTHFGRLI